MIPWFAAALAADPWSGTVGVSTSLVAGPINAGAAGRTLDGAYTAPATFNPALSFGVALGATWTSPRRHHVGLTWTLRRDQALADPAPSGQRVGNSGTAAGVVTSDPVLWWNLPDALPSRPTDVLVGARYALPLSRDSLLCNPSAGGLGATVGVGGSLGRSTPAAVHLVVSADRALYLHAAAPRGGCGVGTLTTMTLSGPVTADAGPGYADVPNPAWTFEQRLQLVGWHAIFGVARRVRGSPAFARAVTSATVGLRQRLDRGDGPARVETLAGDVVIGRARTPVVLSVPWVVSGGYRFPVTRQEAPVAELTMSLTLANQLPTLLFDPGARLAALPATTSLTAALTSTF